MATPEVKLEVAFTAGFATPAASRAWVDISQYVEGQDEINIDYGRGDEMSSVDPGKLSVLLDNRDGRFTPDRTGSPYYPNVQKSRPVRLSVRYDGAWSQRGLWYTDEWSLEWPDGSDGDSKVRLIASSRRARLGQTSPLPSAVREAILSTSPVAYWPMDEDNEVTDANQRQAFRDVTNPTSARDKEVIGVFSRDLNWGPFVQDGTPGPLDESSLVFFPGQRTSSQLPTLSRYIGGRSVFRINTAGAFTVEALVRMPARKDRDVVARLFSVKVDSGYHEVGFVAGTSVEAEDQGVYPDITYYDSEGNFVFPDLVSGSDKATYARLTDGQIHHVALRVINARTAQVFVDGIGGITSSLPSGSTFDRAMLDIIIGGTLINADLWIGHVAVHNRALTVDELLFRADAATTYDETLDQRVVRILSYVGLPSNEIVVEPTVAALLGTQSQLGRSAAEVVDEAAAATGGIAYDDRLGRTYVQARNSRYNSSVSATLSAASQEVEADLGFVLDDRYLRNYVEVAGVEDSDLPVLVKDDASIAEFGRYADSIEIASVSRTERESAAASLVYRQSRPKVRINTVSVEVTALSAAARQAVLAVDISSVLALVDLPAQAPMSSVELFTEGFTEQIGATSHSITFNTTPAADRQVWVLGDSARGALDSTNRIAY